MNKKEKMVQERALLNLVRHSSRFGNLRGYVKVWKNVSLPHLLTMTAVCWKLVNSGYEVLTEAEFTSGGRADIVAISGSVGIIVEILHSETEAKFSKKINTYPKQFILTSVKTKDFDIDKYNI